MQLIARTLTVRNKHELTEIKSVALTRQKRHSEAIRPYRHCDRTGRGVNGLLSQPSAREATSGA